MRQKGIQCIALWSRVAINVPKHFVRVYEWSEIMLIYENNSMRFMYLIKVMPSGLFRYKSQFLEINFPAIMMSYLLVIKAMINYSS